MPQGRFSFRHNIGVALDDARLPVLARQILHEVNQRIRVLDEDILSYDRRIEAMVRDSVLMRRIVAVCGVGPITASAIVASVGDAKLFQQRPAVCRLARSGAASILHRRQGHPRTHHQAR